MMARPAGYSMAEALRTAGRTLEPQAAGGPGRHVTTAGIAVAAGGAVAGRACSWDDLLAASAQERQQRQAGADATAWVAPLALTRWSALLRIVGQLLDTRRIGDCVIDATLAPATEPRDCQVRVLVGDDVLVDGDDVRMHILRVRTQQIAAQEPATPLEPLALRRPWWAFWRR